MSFIFKFILIFSCLNLSSHANYKLEIKELATQGHIPSRNYSEARRHILQNIHLEKDHKGYFVRDVYCDKIIRKRIGPKVMPSNNLINIEHTWPKSRFNGRENYNIQKSDLHILYPTDSRANSSRGNFQFSELPDNGKQATPFCGKSKKDYVNAINNYAFEPPAHHKGNTARAIFYFSIRYNSAISKNEEKTLRLWNKIDPPDDNELRRNDLIESIQGNRNPFIDEPDLADLISDF